ncbi:uncharacterized protein LOC133198522 [Saccostrea echinata]|uniref:uncharacterized protein LOC133198522 n=1 Tax=Saccostrea echinata TaxID=191078 RepID=UPI002A83EE86|nr:uncharacterized protein LOC133198522 [Saccostrea echinata]
MGSEVVRRNLYLTNETTNSSLVFIDYAVPREEADKKCSFYGFKTPDTKTTEHDISYIMQSKETVWTFTDEDRYVLIGHRQWLSIRGCHHINLTHNGQLHHNCNLVFDSLDSMMSSYIGIHKTSCYLIPENIKEFEKTQLPESLCGWRCTDVIETSCGGTEAISLYKVIEVTYKTFSGFKPPHEEQCNALYLADVELPYQRIACQNTSTCTTLCLQK